MDDGAAIQTSSNVLAGRTSGHHLSRPYYQKKGAPQGGVLSPLMWLLLVNRMPDGILGEMSREMPDADLRDGLLLQLFAGDISAVVCAPTEEEVVEKA